MDAMNKKPPSFESLEGFIKENRFEEKLTDFNSFWGKYQDRLEKKPNVFAVKKFRLAVGSAFTAFAVLLVFMAGLFWNGRGVSRNSVLLTVSKGNEVQIASGDSTGWANIDGKQNLNKNVRIRTGKDSQASLRLKNILQVKLASGSEMKVVELASGSGQLNADFRLLAGKVYLSSRALNKRESLTVTAGDLEVRVTGTKFSVSIDPEKECRVSVAEGKVRISPVGSWLDEAVRLGVLNAKNTNDLYDRIRARVVLPSPQSAVLSSAVLNAFNDRCMEIIRSAEKNTRNEAGVIDRIADLWSKTVGENAVIAGIAKNDGDVFRTFNGSKTEYVRLWEKQAPIEGIESEATLLPDGSICYTANQYLYILSRDGSIRAKTGSGDRKTVFTKPVLAGDRIVAGSDNGTLYAFDLGGNLIWSRKDAGIEVFNAFPVFIKNRIALPTADKGMLLIDPDGKKIETVTGQAGEAVYTAPLALKDNTLLVFGNDRGDLTGYDLKTRKTLWKENVMQDVPVYPVIGDEKTVVVLSRKTGEAVGISPASGKIVWKNASDDMVKTKVNPVVIGKYIVLCGNKKIAVIDKESGVTVREAEADSAILSIGAMGDSVLVGSISGLVVRFDPETGRMEDVVKLNNPVFRIISCGSERDEFILFTTGAVIRMAQGDLAS